MNSFQDFRAIIKRVNDEWITHHFCEERAGQNHGTTLNPPAEIHILAWKSGALGRSGQLLGFTGFTERPLSAVDTVVGV